GKTLFEQFLRHGCFFGRRFASNSNGRPFEGKPRTLKPSVAETGKGEHKGREGIRRGREGSGTGRERSRPVQNLDWRFGAPIRELWLPRISNHAGLCALCGIRVPLHATARTDCDLLKLLRDTRAGAE